MQSPPGAELPFDNRIGTSRCHIRLPTRAYRWIPGVCSVRMSSGRRRTVIRFDESWRRGRQTWVVFETPAGWVTRVASSGRKPPQDP
jgi:hypothetical protein